MSLSDLSASELARIDAICLDYESSYRSGNAPEIADVVAQHGGVHASLLQRELELVREELENSLPSHNAPQITDFQPSPPKYFDPVRLPTPGTKIGPYILGTALGQGGMGVVFAAIDTRLDRKVAIKMLAIEIAKRGDLNERFQREARAVAAISHPNIVELFDIGVTDGLPYAVMEYLDGQLLDVILNRGPIDAGEVRRIGAQIADALATAHQANVIHRDLKPSNIMLVPRAAGEISGPPAGRNRARQTESTIIKLFDFGLSRAPDVVLDDSADQTGDGVILGTPGYMAPEQARGEVVTPAADIFSLGCVLFQAFYGRRAFEGRTTALQFAATLNHDPQPDPVRRRADVELADLIDQCLQKDTQKRPPSATEIAKRLRQGGRYEGSIATRVRQPDTPAPLSRRRLLAVAGGGLVGAGIGAFLSLDAGSQLADIDSLAVLSFSEASSANVATKNAPPPIGDAELRHGDQLSASLVHELTRLSDVTVPRFRPMVAETPSEFREIGKLLEVDALVTGSMRPVSQGTKEFLELDIQIVSAKTGSQLWGKRFQTQTADNLLEQSRLATEIASVIGQRLTSTAAELAPPSIESFKCLVVGKTRSDPDSRRGLELALDCFHKAHDVDRSFAEPIAGIALTSITLAAQTNFKESVDLIRQARQRSQEALELDPNSIDARLAVAMLDWQTVARYQQADRAFQELVTVAPNNWQVRHQHGLLQLAMGRAGEAARSLREASQLNPLSVIVKVDRARAEWYRGNQDRAIQDAVRVRHKYEDNLMARGLLIDIYEHQARFDLAAAVDTSLDRTSGANSEVYLRRRAERLKDLPYGPFGQAANAAIWQARTPRGIDDLTLADLTDPMPPMLPLLLAVHPSFGSARMLPRAAEILPAET